jgi:polar amino acid transport system permease protein
MNGGLGWEMLPPLLKGALWTVILCASAGVLGSLIGLVVGLARTSGSRIANYAGAVYTNFIRGVPILVILLFVYFALPLLIPGAVIDKLYTAIIALSIYVGAYMAEIVRGGIRSVPKGQIEAAEALGMGYWTKFRYVIVPQAMKTIVPPAIGVLLSLVKDTSLVSVIGYVELTKAGRIVSILTMEPVLVFAIVGALYFVICYPISLLGRRAELRLSRETRDGTGAMTRTEPATSDLPPATSDLLEDPAEAMRLER